MDRSDQLQASQRPTQAAASKQFQAAPCPTLQAAVRPTPKRHRAQHPTRHYAQHLKRHRAHQPKRHRAQTKQTRPPPWGLHQKTRGHRVAPQIHSLSITRLTNILDEYRSTTSSTPSKGATALHSYGMTVPHRKKNRYPERQDKSYLRSNYLLPEQVVSKARSRFPLADNQSGKTCMSDIQL